MSSDVLDRRRALAYAWRHLAPGDVLPDTEDAGEASPLDARARGAAVAIAQRDDAPPQSVGEACAMLADGVDRAFALPRAEQAAAVAPLLLRAQSLGVQLCELQRHSLQSVRLLRLAIRCRDELSAEALDAARYAVLGVDYGHPEVVDLLVEVTLAGEATVADEIAMALHGDPGRQVARVPGASARFARLLDEEPSFFARRLAIDWIRLSGSRDAVPALRRALRLPHFILRYRALELLEDRFPDAVTADDVAFLIEDALVHPPPEVEQSDENEQANLDYPDLLERALVRLRPTGAIRPLALIADSGRSPRYRLSGGLDAAWALSALAAAFPEHALSRIDALQRHVAWDRRGQALAAASRLEGDLAWPRLLGAAADPTPEIAEAAQQLWMNRRGSPCPLDELAGIEVGFLDAPPSERMRSRLLVLRRAPLQARAAMVEVLLGEAPDVESLALLVFAAGDGSLWELKPREGLPESRVELCETLLTRFGARGAEGIAALAARYPEGRYGYFGALADLLRRRGIPDAARPTLRAAASRRLADAAAWTRYDALAVLAQLGAPPELGGRLWAMATDQGEDDHIRDAAADALATLPESDLSLDGAILDALSAALAASDLPRFALVATFGIRRSIPAAIAVTDRALAEHAAARPDDPAVTRALWRCARELDRAGRLPTTWTAAALARPGTRAFCVAARRSWADATPEATSALRDALESSEPCTAAEAAIAMVHLRAIDAQDEALCEIAARAPLATQSELVELLLYWGAPQRRLWPMLENILISPSRDVSRRYVTSIHALGRDELREDLRKLAPRVVDPELRRDIDAYFAFEGSACYWQDCEDELPDAGR